MKSLRVFVMLILLGLAAPIAIHYRAWSLGIPIAEPAAHVAAQSSNQRDSAVEPQNAAPQSVPATVQTQAVNSQSLDMFDLPGASSSLPLLSVIGFGVFLGGLISALKTRPAHK